MPLFDQCVPQALLEVQKWFGSVIISPLEEDYSIKEISPSGQSIQDEASMYIRPSKTLKPYQRIEIYNQQYWWRLINILQEAYPCVVRLFAYADFNNLVAIPYLVKYQSRDWSLNTLGKNLPKWIEENYTAEDKPLVLDAALLDLQFQILFFQPQYPPINNDELSVKRLYIQPSCSLLKFPYDLLVFRQNFLKQDSEYWMEHPFPELKKCPTFILFFRTSKGVVKSKSISEVEWSLLNQVKEGITVDDLCEWIENKPGPFRQEAETNLQRWFGEWTIMGILYLA